MLGSAADRGFALAPRAGSAPMAGFSLVEALIALALGALVISGTWQGVLQLTAQVARSTDHTALIERARHTSVYLADLLQRSTPLRDGERIAALCDPPSATNSIGVRVLEELDNLCVTLEGRRAQSPVLWVDSLIDCEGGCPAGIWPSHVWVEPGCSALFTLVAPELRIFSSSAIPIECSGHERYALWSRALIYLRDYAWERGDGIGSLMIKRLGVDGQFDRAQMLVAGVEGWSIKASSVWQLQLLFHGWKDSDVFRPSTLSAWAQPQLQPILGNVERVEVAFAVAKHSPVLITPLDH